jgi:asparagine synthase (glutamine-hydrolysing)
MCGITGFWKPADPASCHPDVLDGMMRTLHHRGPDGRGTHLDRNRGLAMGHTRLSIIDLQGGHQPLRSHDGSILLTVNGEFYDFKRIRASLACEGASFVTKSDSEIAIPLYQRHGLEFVDRLRGEFAFALFDEKRERLILVRDRFGIKPLYYRLTEDAIYYGSEVKSIIAHPDVEPELCPKAALHQMMQVMKPGTTAFEGVEALLPGHMLIVDREGGRLRTRAVRYWDFVFPEADEHDPNPDPERYVLGVRERLIDSIATRLEADVPVGCYLSGGIDSCTILGLATPMQQSPVKAFTIAFDHADYDESEIARVMAEKTGAEQELLRLSSEDLYGEAFETTTGHAERTFYNTLAVAKWRMSKRVRECGFKVVITGEGSDELFGGYPFFKRDMLLHAQGEKGREELQAQLQHSNAVFRGAILAETQQSHEAWNDLCGFTPSWIQPWMITLQACRPLMAEPVLDALESYDPIAEVASMIDPDMVRNRHPLDIAQYTWSKTMLEGQILTWGGDRVDMANSMESRPAFLDHHLAEFATRIPPTLRIRDGVEKWVLREAAKHVLPTVLYEREKFAFMAPPAHSDPAKAAALDKLTSRWLTAETIEAAGLFDVSRVGHFVEMARNETDPVLARRHDILRNHLIQMHILHERSAARAL